MSLKEVGSRLVAKGASQYLAQMNSAAAAHKQVGQSAREGGAGLQELGRGARIAEIGMGNLLARGVEKLVGGLKAMAGEALNSVSSYEKMAMSMTSLVAKEIKTTQGIDDMTEALAMAAPRAQELLGWVQDLAIKSPFDQEGVTMALKTAMAYGFNTKEAQRLTAATIDFTTATGAGSHVMDMAALALGQIKAKGKLAGQEMLQLVNTGINVNQMLKDMGYTMDDVSKGMVSADEFILKFVETMESDFGGAAERSSETVAGLINSMEDLRSMALRELFAPAIQAALPHLAALVSKFQEGMPYFKMAGDFIGRFVMFLADNGPAIASTVAVIGSMVGAFILVTKWSTIATVAFSALTAVTGALTAVTGALSGAVMFLLSPIGLVAAALAALVGAFALIGVAMKRSKDAQQDRYAEMEANARAHTAVQDSITQAQAERQVASMGEMGDKIIAKQNQQHQATAENSRSWGENIIIQFAQGMANALSAVLTVLMQIGQAIANWLSPGSPPKLLPDLPDWGKSAMDYFLKGMTLADFDLVRNAAAPIERLFSSMAGLGQMDESSVIPGILKAKDGLAELATEYRKTGSVAEQSFDRFFKAVDISDKNMQGYVRQLFNVQAAQDKLNKLTAEFERITAPMHAELDEIAKKRQGFINTQRKEELESILERAKANGDADAVMLAEMELREMALKDQIAAEEERAGAAISAAEESLTAEEEKLAIQEELINAQIEQNELMKQQIDLLKQLAEGGAGGAGAGGLTGKEPKAGGKGKGMPKIGEGLGGLGAGIGAALENPITAAADNIKKRLEGLVDEIKAPFEGIGEKVVELGDTWREVFANMSEKGTEWKEKGIQVLTDVMEKGIEMIAWLQGARQQWQTNIELMKQIIQLLKDRVRAVVDEIKEKFNEAKIDVGLLKDVFKDALDTIRDKFNEAKDKVVETVDQMRDKLDPLLQKIIEIKDAFYYFWEWISNVSWDIDFDFNIPDWGIPGSPLPVHTAWKSFNQFMKTASFSPEVVIPKPVQPVASPQQIQNSTTIYNNQQVQGIGAVNTSPGGVTAAEIEAIVQRVLAGATS